MIVSVYDLEARGKQYDDTNNWLSATTRKTLLHTLLQETKPTIAIGPQN